MKKSLFTLLLSIPLVFSFAQDLRFSYTVTNNGATSEVQIFVSKFAAGTENMTGFTSNLYYNNGESTIASFDATPAGALGWAVDQGATNHVQSVPINTAIPITHTGFGTINVIDLMINGTNVAQSPLHILTINLDNTVGSPAQSPVYLASSAENHPALEYVGNDFIGHPVIVTPVALPVELLDFTAEALPNQASLLKWVTTNETHSKGFEIERARASDTNPTWESIGWEEGAGTASASAEYSFVDLSPYTGENLYRLKLVDIDGDFAYSNVRSVRFFAIGDIQVFPNPTSDWVQIDIGNLTDQDEVEYHLFDERGRVLRTGSVYSKKINRINLSEYTAGIYFFQLLLDDQNIEKKIVKMN